MLNRRHVLGGLLAAPAVLRATRAGAQEVSMRLHHFMSGVSPGHNEFLVPWAEKVAAESDGRIKIDVFPSMQLGGTPPQLYDQARDGVVDVVWTLPGYTANRFPKIEVFELPFVGAQTSRVNSRAVQEFAEANLADEFAEVHPICFWASDGGLIHTDTPVTTLDDMAGLKIRFPTRLAGEGLAALGAVPVGMPVPQVPEAVSQGVIDGAAVPWEIVPSIKLHELVSNHLGFPGTPTFYVSTFLLAMNKARYEGLPEDLRAVIDANSGQAATDMVAAMFDTNTPKVIDLATQAGNTITTLSPEEVARWTEATQPVRDAWIAASADQGFDGAALLAEAQALIAKHGQGA
ncbi:TRAP transporter substrate-binding protein [Rubellimicrobium aerolatum]|uniref:TRAP transporter substrate-binding protein n=1 Tax=Rubellimicrobium aerolatum TaxID=490979 RepID=A0ABW0SCI8_9RHOB|nr:TRAP transporter substrate-binding protein [Rubellimicrobium aerolatum]MBP1806341.1 TRAP-type C4-dicarboxylate transport system substrate-binding protein [Rubellimicrobium aerolatum]